LAEKWEISETTAVYIKDIEPQLLSGKYPELAALYLKKVDGAAALKSSGDMVLQPALAGTFWVLNPDLSQLNQDFIQQTRSCSNAEGNSK
jgi:hypothetical protein